VQTGSLHPGHRRSHNAAHAADADAYSGVRDLLKSCLAFAQQHHMITQQHPMIT
jgi:hypothetical protein